MVELELDEADDLPAVARKLANQVGVAPSALPVAVTATIDSLDDDIPTHGDPPVVLTAPVTGIIAVAIRHGRTVELARRRPYSH